MTTLVPREPYSLNELSQLYPKNLKLQLVQILLRHGNALHKESKLKSVINAWDSGERSPTSPRFQNAGLAPHWPYCNSAKQMSSATMDKTDCSTWDDLRWRRRLETFGHNDSSVIASGPAGEVDVVCQSGELTDKGRETTLALGQRLRNLYVDQLGYMPKVIQDADMIYLRASPMSRALESVQQSFWGMYPPSARTASFPPPTIITRTFADETLFPNEASCRRFNQLSRAFAQRAADRWNETDEMDYINSLISRWMPEESKRVAVDSHPRLSGIMDTINSTLAHGPKTRLPPSFYDPKGREIIEKIGVEEWFAGYQESHEYRKVGIGALVGDIVARMLGSVERKGNDGLLEIGGKDGMGPGRGGEKGIKFAMSGCHDTTLAAILSSLGAFEAEKWPPYTSHLAVELFREENISRTTTESPQDLREPVTASTAHVQSPGPHFSIFGSRRKENLASEGFARKPMDELTPTEKDKLRGLYVRVRYNDRPIVVPGCKLPGKHLEGDESFCTLEAFKSIVDKFTPKNWKEACASRLDEPAFPDKIEPAVFALYASQHSVPSPDGRLIATLYDSHLIIRSSTNGILLQNFPIPQDATSPWHFLQWSVQESAKTKALGLQVNISSPKNSSRVLLANDDTILIWDVDDSQWNAVIDGAASNLGNIAKVCFGFAAREILVFSVFGIKVTIWSLVTSRGVEIRDTKSSSTCYDYRPRTGHLAILTRASGHDNMMLLAPETYELIGSVDLTTVDAQGVKWSPDGRWLVVWDAASMGYKISIYTADGHLFKVYSGGQDADNIGLGAKILQWSPSADSLTIGDFSSRIMLLQINTFSPNKTFVHTSTIDDPQVSVWEEQISASNERSYIMASQPTCPPMKLTDASSSNVGVSIIEYNIDGSLFATRDDSIPSTVWIWSPKLTSAVAVLIHHSPVKRVQWHPLITDLILVQCNVARQVVHLWNATWEIPKVVNLPLDKLGGRLEAAWLIAEASDNLSLMLGNAHNYTIAELSHGGELNSCPKKGDIIGAGPEDMFDEGNSLDLSPIRISHDEFTMERGQVSLTSGPSEPWNLSDEIDDTFHNRRHVKALT